MPADRRIIVKVQGEGFRDPDLQGEYIEAVVTDYPMWASRRDVSQELKIQREGTRDETSRDWRVRWNSRIASTPLARLKVEDGGGDLHNHQHG